MKIARIVSKDGEKHLELSTKGFLGSVTLTGIITALITIGTFFLITLPSAKQDRRKAEFELYNMVLREESGINRQKSMNFLVAAKLVEATPELKEIIDNGDLPDWSGILCDPTCPDSANTKNNKTEQPKPKEETK